MHIQYDDKVDKVCIHVCTQQIVWIRTFNLKKRNTTFSTGKRQVASGKWHEFIKTTNQFHDTASRGTIRLKPRLAHELAGNCTEYVKCTDNTTHLFWSISSCNLCNVVASHMRTIYVPVSRPTSPKGKKRVVLGKLERTTGTISIWNNGWCPWRWSQVPSGEFKQFQQNDC